MKFELVEFYPIENKKFPKTLGTVHIYAIDCELDIRGILVTKQGAKGIFFNLPHYIAQDQETGENVRYPHIRWTNQSTHKEMMDFLHMQVKPEIKKRLNITDREVKCQESRAKNA